MSKPYYTVTEVAAREGISTRRVRLLCEQGRVYYCEKAGNVWLILKNYRIEVKKVGRPRKRVSPWAQLQSASTKK